MNHWQRIFLGIGSNLGDRRAICQQAVTMLDKHTAFRVTAVSSWHETAPEGMVSANMFINGVIEGRTTLSAQGVMELCLEIEKRAGRDRAKQGMDRPLDLDILYIENVITGYDGDDRRKTGTRKKERLTVPHPSIPERIFVLAPWAELAPELHVPIFNRTVSEMLRDVRLKRETT